MQNHRISRLTLATLAALSLSGVAHAQDSVGGPWYVSPSLGVMSPDNDWNPNKNAVGGGLKFGRVLAPHWDAQLGLNTARSSENGASYRQTLLSADALYLFREPGLGFRPFLSAGLGAARDSLSGPIDAAKTSPFVSAGFGARYQFTPAFALEAGWKRVHSVMSGDTRTALGLVPDNNPNNNYLGLALNYNFGGSAAPAPMMAKAEPPPPLPAPAPVVQPPPPAPVPAPVAPPPAPRMEKVTLQGTELFALNKSELRSPQPRLDELAAALVQNPSISGIVVSGHTDRLGTDKLNKPLSQRRAQAVKAYLVNKGVAADRIQAVGKGSSQPVVTCKEKNKAKLVQCLEPNRRVEVEPVSFQRQVK